MPRVDPYHSKYEQGYDYGDEPSTSGAVLFIGVIAAIIVASLLWASYNPQPGLNNTPAMSTTQPATPKIPPATMR